MDYTLFNYSQFICLKYSTHIFHLLFSVITSWSVIKTGIYTAMYSYMIDIFFFKRILN